jgi:PAS domain S-box-containing protein
MKKKRLHSGPLFPERRQFDEVLKSLSASCVNASVEELDREIEQGLAEIAACFHAQRVTVWELSEDGQEADLTHSYAEEGDEPPVQNLVHQTLPHIMDTVRKRGTFFVSRIDDLPESAEIDKRTLRSTGVKSLLSVPLFVGGSPRGALSFSFIRTEHKWTDTEVTQARQIGEVIASALDRKRSYRALQHRIRFETLISDLSASFVNIPAEAVDGEINKWLGRLAEFFGIDRCTLAVFTEDGAAARFTHSWATEGNELDLSLAATDLWPWSAGEIKRGKPVRFSHLDELPKEAAIDKQSWNRLGAKSNLSVPLLSEDRVMGVLSLGSLRAHRTWEDHLVERVRMVGSVLSNALARKRAEALIRESEEFNRTVIGSLGDHIAVLDRNGKILEVNEAWSRFARENGEPRSARIGPGVSYFDICNRSAHEGEQVAQAALDGIRSVMEGSRESFQIEYPCNSPTEERWFLMKVSPLKREEGGAIVSHVNITERKRSAEALRESEERFREFFENTPDYCYIISPEGNILNINRAALQALGYQRRELIGKPVSTIYAAESRPKMKRLFADWNREGRIRNEEMVVVTKAGNKRIVILNVGAVREKNGEFIHSTSVQTDITDRKKGEDDLRQAYAEIKRLKERVEAENIYLRKEIDMECEFEDVIGQSDALKYVLYRAKQVAPTDSTVLILGETGTGKGLIARAVHQASTRKDRPLIHVNCASLPVNLIESELFGREKGAFTGAQQRQVGRFELADGGTIFLDEIAELPLEVQAKLLRVIEDGQFERLGSPRSRRVDVRMMASTNRDLEEQISKGRFREDLFYRLNVFPITMPPLRQRQEDIPALVRHFVDKYNKKTGKAITGINPSAMKSLQGYAWPGNVRELENIIERSVITTHGEILQLADPLENRRPAHQEGLPRKGLVEVERAHILKTLKEVGWTIEGPKGAAQVLGLKPSTLRSRMKKLGIRKAENLSYPPS